MSIQAYDLDVSNQIVASGGITLSSESNVVLQATPSKVLITQGNTQTIQAQGLVDTTTGNFWASGASVSGSLVDQNGNAVTGATGIVLGYQSTSAFPGTFVGSFGDNTFYPAIGTGYTLVIDGVFNGTYFHAEITAEVVARTG